MGDSASVKSFEALRDAKAAIAEFRQAVTIALGEASTDVQRTIGWLQGEQAMHWKVQIRKRDELLQRARSELHRAQLAAQGSEVSTREQRKLVAKAEAALQEAHDKAQRCRKWTIELERQSLLFRGACQPIARASDGDLARAEGRLDLLLDRLDAYLRGAGGPPPAGGPA